MNKIFTYIYPLGAHERDNQIDTSAKLGNFDVKVAVMSNFQSLYVNVT